jgi:aspartyl-tRNA(Asn)/glutamyl-tRNA(Gln) amidotransferase subunit B
MAGTGKYEVVVGLEVHVRLLTRSKLFCGDDTGFGATPNSQVSPISLGHPGTLPRLNRQAAHFAAKMGMACNCEVSPKSYFARKHYFYPDLPKGYQLTQHAMPICSGGYITIDTADGEKVIRLNRIHLEEDAGRSMHDMDESSTLIDYNRAGTALIEIVSEPDIRSGEEAYAYLAAIRRTVRYLGISDGNMEEGSLRCDVNISVRPEGSTTLGTKVEIKNLNSLRNVRRAVESEAERLVDLAERGEKVLQQTRSFDAATGTSFPIRDKEDADDYRYFPDPDLPPFSICESTLVKLRAQLPKLSAQRTREYVSGLQLSHYDAGVLTDEKEFSDYFEQVIASGMIQPKTAANWMLGPVKSWLNEHQAEISQFPLLPGVLASLASLAEQGITSYSAASTRLFSHLLANPSRDPTDLAKELNLVQQSDAGELEPVIDEVLQKFSSRVAEFRKGKKGLLSLFVGEVMKRTGGKADPKLTNTMLLEKLKS